MEEGERDAEWAEETHLLGHPTQFQIFTKTLCFFNPELSLYLLSTYIQASDHT